MDFGKGELSEREKTFYRRFSKEILSLGRSLPESAQSDALRFLIAVFRDKLGRRTEFFPKLLSPAWSIIYWLSRDSASRTRPLKKEDVRMQ